MSTIVYVGHVAAGKGPLSYIAKSVDGGLNFSATGYNDATAIPMCLYHFTENIGVCLAVWWLSPADPCYLQVLRTTDGWATNALVKAEEIEWAFAGRFWNDIAYGNGVLLAVGDGDVLLRSADNGATWTKISTGLASPTSQKLTGVIYAGGLWEIMAISGGTKWRVIHSHDEGLTWHLGTEHTKPGGAAGSPAIGDIWMISALAGWLGWYDFFSTPDMGETTALISGLRVAWIEYPLTMLYAEGDDYGEVDLYKINVDGSITKICDLAGAYCLYCRMSKAADGTIYLNTGLSNVLYSSDGASLTTLGSVDVGNYIFCEYGLSPAAPVVAAKSLWRVERVDTLGRSPRNVGRSVR